MDSGFDAEGEETKEYRWIGRGGGESMITAKGNVASRSRVHLRIGIS
jgi:hypothetical protein